MGLSFIKKYLVLWFSSSYLLASITHSLYYHNLIIPPRLSLNSNSFLKVFQSTTSITPSFPLLPHFILHLEIHRHVQACVIYIQHFVFANRSGYSRNSHRHVDIRPYRTSYNFGFVPTIVKSCHS